jgi:sec-independent protein translocase protein TatC
VGLFLLGAALAYFFVFEPVLKFFFGFSEWLGLPLEPRISEWLSFVLLLPLAFGVSFQLPLVMLFLERIGVFTVDAYVAKWRIAVLVIAVVSMVLSPGGDPYSMMFMLVPLVALYFGGVLLCRWMPAVRRPDEVYD